MSSSTRKSKPASKSRPASKTLQALRIVLDKYPDGLAPVSILSKNFYENDNIQRALAGKRDETGKTPFMVACARGDIKRVRKLKDLAAPEKIIDVQDEEGNTALVYAIINHKNRTVDILLNEGKYHADPNLAENFGYTPLEQAIEVNNLGALKLLIKKGADVNKLHLDDKGKPLGSALFDAINEGNIEAVKLLVGAGANVNLAKSDGTTPLIISVIKGDDEKYGVKKGHRKIIELLLDKGANPELAIPYAKNFAMRAFLKHYRPKTGGSRQTLKKRK